MAETTDRKQIPEKLFEEFLPRIRSGIIAEYNRLPDKSNEPDDQDVEWMRAFLAYINAMGQGRAGRFSWLHDNITGLMVISAFMALAFGYLGAWGLTAGGATQTATAGFLDIAKLFAGTLVGAAGATAIVKR
jgi:hypothetical protein